MLDSPRALDRLYRAIVRYTPQTQPDARAQRDATRNERAVADARKRETVGGAR